MVMSGMAAVESWTLAPVRIRLTGIWPSATSACSLYPRQYCCWRFGRRFDSNGTRGREGLQHLGQFHVSLPFHERAAVGSFGLLRPAGRFALLLRFALLRFLLLWLSSRLLGFFFGKAFAGFDGGGVARDMSDEPLGLGGLDQCLRELRG